MHSDRAANLNSEELRSFLEKNGVKKTRTTSYNPQGNGQCERYNGVIWKQVRVKLARRHLSERSWADVLPDALADLRFLRNTVTGVSPHKLMFGWERRVAFKVQPQLSRVQSADSSDEAICDIEPRKRALWKNGANELIEVEVVRDVNPWLVRVRFRSGREEMVSKRRLAPLPPLPVWVPDLIPEPAPPDVPPPLPDVPPPLPVCVPDLIPEPAPPDVPPETRTRSGRIVKKPDRLNL